jgi:23S rRNA (cytidine1920-2'-O)/16S rRNA (cytidine1409-2'-O)-methyltransferase
VRRGIAESREQAQAAITTGQVLVRGAPTVKPSRLVAASDPIELVGPPPRFVGRGGEKLDAALDHFAVDPYARAALDAGASTGGFTDCLLQRGARHVVAVDVGHGQLHPRLRADPRVTVLERTDIRRVDLAELGAAPAEVLTADLSFISLTAALPAVLGPLAAPDADAILLVKPQFEAGAAEASRGKGVIREPAVWAAALGRVCSALSAQGGAIMGGMVSPLLGAEGNAEFFVHVKAHAAADGPGVDVDALVARAAARVER